MPDEQPLSDMPARTTHRPLRLGLRRLRRRMNIVTVSPASRM